MADLAFELELTRSSGVLAGIVASLAQAGIHVQSQRLDRGDGDRPASLAVIATGELVSLEVLMERMRETRGVSHLVRLEVDGELRVANGEPILEPLEDHIESDDIAELSSGLEGAAAADADPPAEPEPSATASSDAASEPQPPTAATAVAADDDDHESEAVEEHSDSDPADELLAEALDAPMDPAAASNPDPAPDTDATHDPGEQEERTRKMMRRRRRRLR